MLLSKVLADIDYTVRGDKDIAVIHIDDIVYDSRRAVSGTMFVCLVGAVSDGHSFAAGAYEKGCRVFMTERSLGLPSDAVQIEVQDTRLALALASAAFFEYPARSLMVIGITGTKGKTTTASIIADILNEGGINTAYIGTTGIVICGERTPTKNTTPESYELHKAFRKMVERGVACVVMEVSSQAIFMRRVEGIHFHIGVFTNLSPDHIGGVEHPTFEHYMACKAELFRKCRFGILNSDDEHFDDMISGAECAVGTFGISKGVSHDVSAHTIVPVKRGNILGTGFICRTQDGETEYELRMPGDFNVYNALAAISVARRMKISEEIIRKALFKATVRGRFEIVEALPDAVTVIDYAHNAVSMRAALETIRKYSPERLVVVFGSVGGRTKLRRGELGEVASELADMCIVTSDNPDFEPSEDIIRDIEKVIVAAKCPCVSIVDRREAVKYAIDNARPGDCILFAGKGHEDYQIIRGEYIHYDEREEIMTAAISKLARVN